MARLSQLTLLALQWPAIHAGIIPSSLLDELQSLASHAPRAACSPGSTIPNLWSISNIAVAYTEDETVHQGNASFTLLNTQTNAREDLKCTLRFNSICEIAGTPKNKDLRIWVQVNLLSASITITEPWKCDGNPRAEVTGMAEVELVCPEGHSLENGLSCKGLETPGLASGVVVVEEPEPAAGSSSGLQRRGHGLKPKLTSDKGGRGAKARAVAPYPVRSRKKSVEILKGGGTPAMSKVGAWSTRSRFLGVAQRGRAMAHAAVPEDEEEKKPKELEEETKKTEDKSANSEKVKEGKKEEFTEKKMIEQLEHRLCSPSCLREAIPEPESGHHWTKGPNHVSLPLPKGSVGSGRSLGSGRSRTLPVLPGNRVDR